MATTNNISILREHLTYVVERVVMFAFKKNPPLPVCGAIQFTHDGLQLIVSAFDMETRIDMSCQCDVKGTFEGFCVNAFAVSDLLKFSVEEKVEISLKKRGENMRAVFKIGKSKHELNAFGPDMPVISLKPMIMSMPLESRHLIKASSTVGKLIDGSNTPIGMGMGVQYIEPEKTMYLWGSQGQNMGGYKIPMEKPEGYVPFTIPYKLIRCFGSLLNEGETITVNLDGPHLIIQTPSCTLTSVLPVKPYPPAYTVLSTKCTNPETEVAVHVGEYRMSLKRMMIHSNETKWTLVQSFRAQELAMSMAIEELNQEGEEMVGYQSAMRVKPIDIGVNINFLAEVINICEADMMNISVFTEKQPLLFTFDHSGNAVVCMVMPIVYKNENEVTPVK